MNEDCTTCVYGFHYFQVLFGPTAGIIMDYVAKNFKKRTELSEGARRTVGCTICIILNLVFGITASLPQYRRQCSKFSFR